jgi:hypothetical protein
LRFTTLCAVTVGRTRKDPFKAQPTIRADSFVPNAVAIAPKDVTLPLGICLAISNTSSKKDSSFLPEGFTDFNFSEEFFLGGMFEGLSF